MFINCLLVLLLITCGRQSEIKENVSQDMAESHTLIAKFISDELVGSLESNGKKIISKTDSTLTEYFEKIGAVSWEPLSKGKPKDEALAQKMGLLRMGKIIYSKDISQTEAIQILMKCGYFEYVEADRPVSIEKD